MSNVRIVTDSTSDIPKQLVDDLNITVVPLKVIFGEQEYLDGVEIGPADFYEKLASSSVSPTTSQPTPYQFEEVYKEINTEDENAAIISIHISSKLSGTYQSAFIASNNVKEQIDVTVVDSKRASYAIGIIVVEIAKLAKSGATKEECLARLDELIKETAIYFMVDTLEFLQRNGRIGKASALLGSLLKIKPILSLTEDGEVYPYDKVRGQKKAFAKIYGYIEKEFGNDPINIAVIAANSDETRKEILEEVRERFNVSSEVIADIGPVIGAHVGPGTIAITVTKAK